MNFNCAHAVFILLLNAISRSSGKCRAPRPSCPLGTHTFLYITCSRTRWRLQSLVTAFSPLCFQSASAVRRSKVINLRLLGIDDGEACAESILNSGVRSLGAVDMVLTRTGVVEERLGHCQQVSVRQRAGIALLLMCLVAAWRPSETTTRLGRAPA